MSNLEIGFVSSNQAMGKSQLCITRARSESDQVISLKKSIAAEFQAKFEGTEEEIHNLATDHTTRKDT